MGRMSRSEISVGEVPVALAVLPLPALHTWGSVLDGTIPTMSPKLPWNKDPFLCPGTLQMCPQVGGRQATDLISSLTQIPTSLEPC